MTNDLPYQQNQENREQWTILCDFDGTIALADVTDTLLQRHATLGWDALESAWRRGEIGSAQCMAGQVALLDALPQEIDAVVGSIEIDPSFADFVSRAAMLNMPIHVVSDGLDSLIERMLALHGITSLPIVANHLVYEGNKQWRLEFPHMHAECSSASGTCKCACADRWSNQRRVLYIGDGQSDFCVAGKVDFVLAKSVLIDYATSHSVPHRAIAGFADALKFINELDAGWRPTELTVQDVQPLTPDDGRIERLA